MSFACVHRMEGHVLGHLFSRVPVAGLSLPFDNDLGETLAPWPLLWQLGCMGLLPGVLASASTFPKLATPCHPQWW